MIELVPMTQQDFDAYLEWSIPLYGEEMVQAGYWTAEQAAEKSRKEMTELLPQGLSTPDQFLFIVREVQSGEKVGLIWLGVHNRQAGPVGFIYDFLIEERARRQGYGTQTLLAAEEKVRQLGLSSIGLHVFGFNKPAIALYEKLGYEMASIQMRKKL